MRGRETSMWARNIDRLLLVGTPNRGPNPQPRHVPWPGVESATFPFSGWHPTNEASSVRASASSLSLKSVVSFFLLLPLHSWVLPTFMEFLLGKKFKKKWRGRSHSHFSEWTREQTLKAWASILVACSVVTLLPCSLSKSASGELNWGMRMGSNGVGNGIGS